MSNVLFTHVKWQTHGDFVASALLYKWVTIQWGELNAFLIISTILNIGNFITVYFENVNIPKQEVDMFRCSFG